MIIATKYNIDDWVYVFKQEDEKPNERKRVTLLYQEVKISHIDASVGKLATAIDFSYYGYNKAKKYVWFRDYQVVKTHKDLANLKCGNIFGKEFDVKVNLKKGSFNTL